MLRLLFKLVDWVDTEAGKFLNEQTTITDAIAFVISWTDNRLKLKEISDSEELKVCFYEHYQ